MYYRVTSLSINPSMKDKFLEQSKTLKSKIRKRLGEGILSALMVEIGKGRLLLIGKYDCEESAVRGKQISEEIFAEMDENFLLSPPHSEEGPVIYSVDY